jgi:hypothetical protein
MNKERNKKRKDVPELTIFEERIVAKKSAKEVLKIAKKQEAEKIKKGHRFVMSEDGKTMRLVAPKKKKNV